MKVILVFNFNSIFHRLTIDHNYIGEPPAIEITIKNLNDNVDKNFLSDMLQKASLQCDDIIIYYHPETNKHLGIARLILRTPRQMKMCIEKFNQKSVMGKVSNYLFILKFGSTHVDCF